MVQLQEAGVPAGALLSAPAVLDSPQVKARDYFVELGGDHIEKETYAGSPVRFDGQRGTHWHRAPKLGEHNEEVLRELLGMTDAEISRLQDEGVITNVPPTLEEARRSR